MTWSDVYFNEFSFANRGLDDVSGKKAVGLDWQNKNFARASRFFGHFFAVAARLQRGSAY